MREYKTNLDKGRNMAGDSHDEARARDVVAVDGREGRRRGVPGPSQVESEFRIAHALHGNVIGLRDHPRGGATEHIPDADTAASLSGVSEGDVSDRRFGGRSLVRLEWKLYARTRGSLIHVVREFVKGV